VALVRCEEEGGREGGREEMVGTIEKPEDREGGREGGKEGRS
jgi:hypothetical protein